MIRKSDKQNVDFEVWFDDSKSEPFGKPEKRPPKTKEQKEREEAFFKELDKEFKVA